MEGHAVRSRARWIVEGEKPTKYFCNLEKRNYLNKISKKLEVEGNHMIYNQAEILNEVKNCYKNLYANKDLELLHFDLEEIIKSQVQKLDKHTSEVLERPLSEKEIFEVLKDIKKIMNIQVAMDIVSIFFF
jgi:hypothetical protein